MVPPGQPIPAEAALIILPGSKATIADLQAVRDQGWDIDIRAHHRRGRPILGICGGYQMLGRRIEDPDGIEGSPGSVEGLGLLNVETRLTAIKILERTNGVALGQAFSGYEMHVGRTDGPDCLHPFALLEGDRPDGASNGDGTVMGSYIHGLFASTALRSAFLARLGHKAASGDYQASVNDALDQIAIQLEDHADLEGLIRIANT